MARPRIAATALLLLGLLLWPAATVQAGKRKGKLELPAVYRTIAGPGRDEIAPLDRLDLGPLSLDTGCVTVTSGRGTVRFGFAAGGVALPPELFVPAGLTLSMCRSAWDEIWITCTDPDASCDVAWRVDRLG